MNNSDKRKDPKLFLTPCVCLYDITEIIVSSALKKSEIKNRSEIIKNYLKSRCEKTETYAKRRKRKQGIEEEFKTKRGVGRSRKINRLVMSSDHVTSQSSLSSISNGHSSTASSSLTGPKNNCDNATIPTECPESAACKKIHCNWQFCFEFFVDKCGLLDHLAVVHIKVQTQQDLAHEDSFTCFWVGCKLFGTSSCSYRWLLDHVLSHGKSAKNCDERDCSRQHVSAKKEGETCRDQSQEHRTLDQNILPNVDTPSLNSSTSMPSEVRPPIEKCDPQSKKPCSNPINEINNSSRRVCNVINHQKVNNSKFDMNCIQLSQSNCVADKKIPPKPAISVSNKQIESMECHPMDIMKDCFVDLSLNNPQLSNCNIRKRKSQESSESSNNTKNTPHTSNEKNEVSMTKVVREEQQISNLETFSKKPSDSIYKAGNELDKVAKTVNVINETVIADFTTDTRSSRYQFQGTDKSNNKIVELNLVDISAMKDEFTIPDTENEFQNESSTISNVFTDIPRSSNVKNKSFSWSSSTDTIIEIDMVNSEQKDYEAHQKSLHQSKETSNMVSGKHGSKKLGNKMLHKPNTLNSETQNQKSLVEQAVKTGNNSYVVKPHSVVGETYQKSCPNQSDGAENILDESSSEAENSKTPEQNVEIINNIESVITSKAISGQSNKKRKISLEQNSSTPETEPGKLPMRNDVDVVESGQVTCEANQKSIQCLSDETSNMISEKHSLKNKKYKIFPKPNLLVTEADSRKLPEQNGESSNKVVITAFSDPNVCKLGSSSVTDCESSQSNVINIPIDDLNEVVVDIEVDTVYQSKELESAGEGRKCQWLNCAGLLKGSVSLLDHMKTQHLAPIFNDHWVACRWVGCKVYEKKSCSVDWLERHILQHVGNRPFQCIINMCRKRFTTQAALNKHVNFHLEKNNKTKGGKNGNDAAEKAFKKKKNLTYIKGNTQAQQTDFYDDGVMEIVSHQLEQVANQMDPSIQPRFPQFMRFYSMIKGKRLCTGKPEYLVEWYPYDVLPDSWLDETSFCKFKDVPARQLPKGTLEKILPFLYADKRKRPRKLCT